MFTETEFKNLDDARGFRNPVVHFRRPLGDDTVEFRSVTRNEQPYAILEEDARHVMRAALRLIARQAI